MGNLFSQPQPERTIGVVIPADFRGIPIEFQTKNAGICNRFVAPWGAFIKPSILSLLRWKFWTENRSNIPWNKPEEIDKVHPVHKIDKENIYNLQEGKLQVTWIGHATMLLQFDGANILADPVFSEYSGPFWRFGYKRYRPPACTTKDLPQIDAVIISHNHFDHLDTGSVKDIVKYSPDAVWFVAKGMKSWLTKRGCRNVVELDWWDGREVEINGHQFRFFCTPTQHWCQRGLIDFNKALWCGWIVEGAKYKFYFAGDTGYQDRLFKRIGEKYGPFDIAAIPIGAYDPRYITEYQHVCPEQAVNIHKDIQSQCSIGMHWGAFELTNEYYLEPPQKVEEAMLKKKLDPKSFFSLCIGETWVVGEDRDYDPPFMERGKVRKASLNDEPKDTGTKHSDSQKDEIAEILIESGTSLSDKKNK
ncbi:NAPEP-like protein [Mya arenaria]|uniref:NAPEP-like protein n=1 Tax=Mya arenaria TaxID=6604 RepID=A0ABY7EU09_MYAAR|nr:N-acyl-phosphatidylethanolamine-hydrolyzing phospholipase D-like isoform X2 [Mya arenaria]WAR12186.1 NAPEP-like protein [Mya arenaria]